MNHRRFLSTIVTNWSMRPLSLACFVIVISIGPAAVATSEPTGNQRIPCPSNEQPAIPAPPGCEPEALPPQNFCLRLAVEPGTSLAPGALVTYQTTVITTGRQTGRDLVVQLPFRPAAQELVDAKFSRPNAWVSAVLTNTVELRIDRLGAGEAFTATLRLRTRENVPDGTVLASQATLRWSRADRNIPLRSNRLMLTTGATFYSRKLESLTLAPRVAQRGSQITITYQEFATHEPVSLWYEGPGGHNSTLGNVTASHEGRVDIKLDTAHLPPGRYQLAARGSCSLVIATGELTITN